MGKSKLIRVDYEFEAMIKNFQKQFEKETGKKISFVKATAMFSNIHNFNAFEFIVKKKKKNNNLSLFD